MNTETPSVATNKSTSLSKWKVALLAVSALAVLAIIGAVGLIYFPGIYLNDMVKNQIVSEFTKANPGYSIAIPDLDIYLLSDNIELSSVSITSDDSTFSCRADNPSLRGIGWWQLIWHGIDAANALDNSVARAGNIVVKSQKYLHEIRCRYLKISLRDSLITADSLVLRALAADSVYFNGSEYRKTRYKIQSPKLTIAGSTFLALLHGNKCEADKIITPEITIDIKAAHKDTAANADSAKEQDASILASLRRSIQIDSINIENARIIQTELQANDSLASTGQAIHVTNLRASLKNEAFSAKNIELLPMNEPDGYSVRCGGLAVSLRDSSVTANDVDIRPLKEVNDFFAASKYRQTRYSFAAAEIAMRGLAFSEAMRNTAYKAHSIELQKPSVSIQVSVFKPNKKPLVKGNMPNEILAAFKQIIQIDSINARNGKILYEEYCQLNARPAFIVFNDTDVQISGITNTKAGGDTADIRVSSEFMNGGILKIAVRLPLTSPKFDMQLSASLTKMSLTKFNAFLENAEHARIKEGVVQSASVTAQVKNGRATGSVRIIYRGFSMSFLDEKSKSDKGIFNIIKSFLANTFKFNSSNERDEDGVLKLGKINYKRKPNDTFVQFTWFSVRRGIADLIGFPDK